MEDSIKLLLDSTGLTCDELLRKLQDYKLSRQQTADVCSVSSDEVQNGNSLNESIDCDNDCGNQETTKTDTANDTNIVTAHTLPGNIEEKPVDKGILRVCKKCEELQNSSKCCCQSAKSDENTPENPKSDESRNILTNEKEDNENGDSDIDLELNVIAKTVENTCNDVDSENIDNNDSFAGSESSESPTRCNSSETGAIDSGNRISETQNDACNPKDMIKADNTNTTGQDLGNEICCNEISSTELGDEVAPLTSEDETKTDCIENNSSQESVMISQEAHIGKTIKLQKDEAILKPFDDELVSSSIDNDRSERFNVLRNLEFANDMSNSSIISNDKDHQSMCAQLSKEGTEHAENHMHSLKKTGRDADQCKQSNINEVNLKENSEKGETQVVTKGNVETEEDAPQMKAKITQLDHSIDESNRSSVSDEVLDESVERLHSVSSENDLEREDTDNICGGSFQSDEDDIFNEEDDVFNEDEDPLGDEISMPGEQPKDKFDSKISDKSEPIKSQQNKSEPIISQSNTLENTEFEENNVEHNVSEQIETKRTRETFIEEDNSKSDETEFNNEESVLNTSIPDDNLRDILKFQLSSLRNRKKREDFKIDSKAVFNTVANRNPKKQLVNDQINLCNNIDNSMEKSGNLIELSNETSFVILDVSGGVNFDSPPKKCDDKNVTFDTDEQIKLTKTNDITKIKGWKNKRFTKDIAESNEDSIALNPVEELRKIISKNKDYMETKTEPKYSAVLNRSFLKTKDPENNKKEILNVSPAQREELHSPKTTDNSPFVSNKLEEFLSTDASLNISYDIPKLVAEDGLISTEIDNSVPQTTTILATEMKDDKNQNYHSLFKPLPEIKAKTLAEKRRMLERIKKRNAKMAKKTALTETVDAKEEDESEIVNRKSFFKSSMQCKLIGAKYSYVLYNGKKVWLPSYIDNVCIAKVSDSAGQKVKDLKREESFKFKRPSLLSDLQQETYKPAKYKPGPLSMKLKLFNEDSDQVWKSCIRKMPKIYLDVVPQLGRPIPIKVQRFLPKFDWELDDCRINFALTALKTKEESSPTHYFRIPLHYQNKQNSIVVRKREAVPLVFDEKKPIRSKADSVEEDIRNVVNDLLRYVETKEIGDSIIKEDDMVPYNEYFGKPTDQGRPTEISENISTIVRKNKKRRKVDLELLRLNCKVVNVMVEESDEVDCQKPYCQMGCICNSLKCDNLFSSHCRKVECMFNCSCPKVKSKEFDDQVILPAGTDLFSDDAVSRIDFRAKRNLAKVEREFTQTIICANDKTIVVSAGGRDRARRATKVPKKYNDYLDPKENEEEVVEPKEVPCENNSLQIRKCEIPLERLDLTNIIPYCLIHETYNCFCSGKCPVRPIKNRIKNDSPKPCLPHPSEIRQKFLSKNKTPEDDCARLKQVFPNYKERNRESQYMKKLMRFVSKTGTNILSIHQVSEPDPLSVDDNGNKTDAEILKDYLYSVQAKLEEKVNLKNDSKAIQRRKKIVPVTQTNITKKTDQSLSHTAPRNIFDGESIIPVKANKQFLQAFTSRISDGYIRILPWEKLLVGFETNQFQVYQCKSKVCKFIILLDDEPPQGFQLLTSDNKTRSEIACWITQGICPVEKSLLSIVLIPSGNCFDMAALLLQSVEEKNTAMAMFLLDHELPLGNTYFDKLNEAVDVMVQKNQNKKQTDKKTTISDIECNKTNKCSLPIKKDSDNVEIDVMVPKKQHKKQTVKKSVSDVIGNKRNKCYLPVGKHSDDAYFENIKDTEDVMLENKQNKKQIDEMSTAPDITSDKKSKCLEHNETVDVTVQKNQNKKEVDKKTTSSDISCDKINKCSLPVEKSVGDTYFEKAKETVDGMVEKNPTKKQVNKKIASFDIANDKTSKFYLPVEKYVHRNLAGENCVLDLTKHPPDPLKEPVELSECDPEIDLTFFRNEVINPMTVFLPKSNLRWRMIYMRSDFTFLSFLKSNYSIKYTDLKSLVHLAKSVKMTVSLHGERVSEGYSSDFFGIYASFNQPDRIFIGPYLLDEDHGLDTLRYMQKSLVSSTLFNKMQGKPGNRIGAWLCETTKIEKNVFTIDLTDDDHPASVAASSNETVTVSTPFTPHTKLRSILKRAYPYSQQSEDIKKLKVDTDISSKDNSFKVLPYDAIKKSTYNRYIVTNIPHLGYIKAYLNTNTKCIMVLWTFHNKVLKFKCVEAAFAFLEQRLHLLLQMIPTTFKIKFALMKDLDLLTCKPIDQKYLSGHYICGEFGIYDIRSLTPAIVKELGLNREDIVNAVTKRVRTVVMYHMCELADILNMKDKGQTRPDLVLEEAKNEIARLEDESKFIVQQKLALEVQKEENANHVLAILDTLPQNRRLVEHNKFKCYITYSSRPKRWGEGNSPSTSKPSDNDSESFIDEDCGFKITNVETVKEDSLSQSNDDCIEIIDSDDDTQHLQGPLTTNLQIAPISPKAQVFSLSKVFGDKVKLQPLPDNYKLTSVLKPKISPEKSPSDLFPQEKIIEKVKFVKMKTGKLVLVKDAAEERRNSGSTKILIKNSKVISVSENE